MKHTKITISIIVFILILVVGVVVSQKLQNQNQQPYVSQTQNQTVSGIEMGNPALGYKFVLPQEFTGIQEERNGLNSLYYAPTTDPTYLKEGMTYGSLFIFEAIPTKDYNDEMAKCQTGKEEYTASCTAMESALGHNNFYYFVALPSQDPPEQFNSSGIIKRGLQAIKDTLQITDVKQAPDMLTYQNLQDGYELDYPADLSTKNYKFGSLNFPFDYSKNFVGEPAFAKVINEQHCGLSGKCEPITTNYVIGLNPLTFTEAQLQKKLPGAQKQTMFDKTVYTYEEGAEGEGVMYYFILPPQGNPMVMVALQYINEQVVTNYQNKPDFTPFDTQKQVALKIIKSLKFFKPTK